MKKIETIKNFESFIAERHNPRKNSIIETAMTRIREKYGSLKDPDKFLSRVNDEGGIETLKDFIIEIIGDEKFSGAAIDYDDIIKGLVCSCILEIQMQKTGRNETK